MTSTNTTAWRNKVWFMRLACPSVLIGALICGSIAWHLELYKLVAINAFLAGVNTMLTWIEWRIFKP